MIDEPLESRPKTRGECENAPRPCPWISCRYHLWAERILGPRDADKQEERLEEFLSASDLEESCALDVAEEGRRTLDGVGKLMGGFTRERVRQIEKEATSKAARTKAKKDPVFW